MTPKNVDSCNNIGFGNDLQNAGFVHYKYMALMQYIMDLCLTFKNAACKKFSSSLSESCAHRNIYCIQ